MIHTQSSAAGEEQRLVIVGGFDASASEKLKNRIAYVLREHDARLVRVEQMDDLIAEIRRDAH